MFCGWQLHTSKPVLAKLGSGTLEIDAITGECSFDGRSISPLSIAFALKGWLIDDLRGNNIPIELITRARLRTTLAFTEIPWKERSTREIFFNDGRGVKTATLHRCAIQCNSEVATDEAVYRSEYSDLEEWPPGWPAT
jgi:hypothetical protein